MNHTVRRQNVASLSLTLWRFPVASGLIHQNLTYCSLPWVFPYRHCHQSILSFQHRQYEHRFHLQLSIRTIFTVYNVIKQHVRYFLFITIGNGCCTCKFIFTIQLHTCIIQIQKSIFIVSLGIIVLQTCILNSCYQLREHIFVILEIFPRCHFYIRIIHRRLIIIILLQVQVTAGQCQYRPTKEKGLI